MHKIITSICLLFLMASLNAQVSENYFQQETNYNIDVTLDDSLHLLKGTVDIEYVNQSSEALKEIYLHLWPNAYKNRSTSFAKQKVENGDAGFYFAKYDKLGGYNNIDIKINDKVVEWNYFDKQLDIALILLSKPLESGESLIINTRFEMKIPETFSRLGHIGQSYQMTQWYPKPAVYDKNGWHPMPYLDQGEFYSEFGSFDVKITLPKNYIVGSTGVLQTESELTFLEEQIARTRKEMRGEGIIHQDVVPFPASDSENKTIRYQAENVHDFAWFADKRFYVEKGEVTLLSGKKVDTYVMFTDKQGDMWSDAIEYVNESIIFYSNAVGDYPYPHATAVQSALSAGAGMEYPMITVIGLESSAESLDEVIAHEVGHNWFYGVLASNERDHAWMDEGFNSYFEHKYMAARYGGEVDTYLGYDNLSGVTNAESNQLEFYLPMRRHTDQAANIPSQDMRLMNYWIGAYSKPAYVLEYLEYYLGSDELDRIIHVYYDTWKFKHPQPSDVKVLFEKETGKDLSWFFDGLIDSTDPLDYKMKSIKKENGNYQLTIQNKGEINAPFPIDVIEENKIVKTVWVEGFEGEQTVNIDVVGADKFVIDSKSMLLDFKRSNNTITEKGGKIEPLSFKFLGGLENPRKTSVYYTPTIGFNKYDGFMVGLALYNTVLPSKKFEWAVAPMFGFKSKEITGIGNLRYHMYPDKLQRVTLGLGYKGFSYENNKDYFGQFEGIKTNLNYKRIKSYVEFELNKKRERSDRKQTITLEFFAENMDRQGRGGKDSIFTATDTLVIDTYEGHRNVWDFIPKISYEIKDKNVLNPFSFKAVLEQNSYKDNFNQNKNYLKISLSADYKLHYKPKKGLYVRSFLGYFLMNSERNRGSVSNYDLGRGSFSLYDQGFSDIWFDEYYFGRSETNGVLSQQINPYSQGGFKLPLTSTNNIGQSNHFVFALNLKLDLPMDFPKYFPEIKPYLDLGYFSNKQPSFDGNINDLLLMNAGVAIEMFNGNFGIYLPIISSKNLKSPLGTRKNYAAKISFYFDLNRMDPNKILYNYEL